MFTAIVLPMLMGLAVFLFGMKLMEAALHQWAGARLTSWLERFTRTPLRGMAASAVLTAMLQSSTAITVIAIGLVNAGVLTFARTLGIVLGTNIGTCLTTELIGLSISGLGLPLLLIGAAGWLASWLLAGALPPPAARRAIDGGRDCGNGGDATGAAPAAPTARGWQRSLRFGSLALAGFALVLLGIAMLQALGPALEAQGLFAWFTAHAAQSLLWGVLAGAAVTALIHSSAAVIAMAMSLAASGALTPELGIAITLGANVGTCATALIAALGGSRAGQLVAWSHVVLNVGGALLFYPLLHQLAALSALLAHDPAAQIARAQTLFNVICSLIALPAAYLNSWSRLSLRS
ncbi:Na/Pi cotransporter family protein [Paenibacillus athensensis]|uniref:Sodium:phosphate symporter n=1 Tax=Paenibacillus athensensis TaxID=1967502 RepID=A0A4Y8PSX3_9BACL|nr:Na/Pi cotransporter family protein [Paenibacillus athensensis]